MDAKKLMQDQGAFQKGAMVLVDGQYGSTGKGLAAALLAEMFSGNVSFVHTNAGPNSGHTSYYGDEKIVLKQLPSFYAQARKRGHNPFALVNAGAIVNLENLRNEISLYPGTVMVHENAAVVSRGDTVMEEGMVERIGSTGKGTGIALSHKVMRDPNAIVKAQRSYIMDAGAGVYCGTFMGAMPSETLVEVSQGFSLSLNASNFYPYTTSRDCTVTQAMSDAGMHPTDFGNCMMVVRTYPIRVAGNSGGCYPDQHETSWEALGVEPELTTVTQKKRRVFTWSDAQFMDAVRVNRPDSVLLNFMNYLDPHERNGFAKNVRHLYQTVMGKELPVLFLGMGPRVEDVEVFNA